MIRLFTRFALLLILLLPAMTATAQVPLKEPQGKPILSVTGAISRTNSTGAALFDLPLLKGLGETTIRTSTPWTKGVVAFTGVSFKDLLAAVGARGTEIAAVALNDYSATMTAAELTEAGAILAWAADGKTLSVREKGPLWIIFPFDADKRYATDAYWSKSVWQIKSLILK
jgi:hypothetical protein